MIIQQNLTGGINMKTYQEIKVKDGVIGKNYYFDEGLTMSVFKKVKAVSERISPSGDRIVMFFCPFYTKKDGKSKHQELTSINTVFELK